MKENILITGANGNLGKAVSAMFLDAGYAVWGLVHDDFPFRQVGKDHWQAGINLLDEAALNKSIDQLKQLSSTVDVLVCTAGGYKPGTLQQTNDEELEAMFELNFITAYNTIKPVYKIMEEQGKGNIFLVGAKPGQDMSQAANSIAYGFSKSLVFRLAEFLNANSHSALVKTFVLVPAIIDTPQNREAMPGSDFSQWVTPETIAAEILKTCNSQGKESKDIIISF